MRRRRLSISAAIHAKVALRRVVAAPLREQSQFARACGEFDGRPISTLREQRERDRIATLLQKARKPKRSDCRFSIRAIHAQEAIDAPMIAARRVDHLIVPHTPAIGAGRAAAKVVEIVCKSTRTSSLLRVPQALGIKD